MSAVHSQERGVLASYFIQRQLTEWLPTQLASTIKAHRHRWVQPTKTIGIVEPECYASATCTECLGRLEVLGFIGGKDDANGNKVCCEDEFGHHLHTSLEGVLTGESRAVGGRYVEGRSWCCKCSLQIELVFRPPLIDLKELENARYSSFPYNKTQGSRELLNTLKTLYRISNNAAGGDMRPIKTTSEKPRKLLKFDSPCKDIFNAMHFEVRNSVEYHPPPIVETIGNDTYNADNLRTNAIYADLVRVCEELFVASGKVQSTLPATESRNNGGDEFKFVMFAPILTKIIDPMHENNNTKLVGLGKPFNAQKTKLEQIYDLLGVLDSASDKAISWAYTRLIEEDADIENREMFDALVTIYKSRGPSDALKSLIESEEDRGLVSSADLKSALFDVVGDQVDVSTIDVDALRSLFDERIARLDTEDAIKTTESLLVIAKAKSNIGLRNYAVMTKDRLVARSVEEKLVPVNQRLRDKLDTWEQLPTGLVNIGNTCYMNCMLQCLYSIVPIRDAVLKYGDGTTWNEMLTLGRQDNGRLLNKSEIESGIHFVALLKQLFEDLIEKRLCNWDNRKLGIGFVVAESSNVTPDKNLADMLLGSDEANTGGWDSARNTSYSQQDVDECMSRCMDLLEHAQPPQLSPGASCKQNSENSDDGKEKYQQLAVQKLVCGMLESSVDGSETPTTELFHTLHLNINSESTTAGADIDRCLDEFFAHSVIDTDEFAVVDSAEGPNDAANKGKKRVKKTRVKDAPPMLFLQIQRVQFDKTSGQSFKNNAVVKIKPHISLARFQDFDDKCNTDSSGRSRPYGWHRWRILKDQINSCNKRLKLMDTSINSSDNNASSNKSILDALKQMGGLMDGVSRWTTQNELDLLDNLPMESSKIINMAHDAKRQIDDMYSELKATKDAWEKEKHNIESELDAVYSSDELKYSLHAVFVHSGVTANFGHYWVYVRDSADGGKERWVKFNDSNVSTVSLDEALCAAASADSISNPYYLVYVKDDIKEHLVNLGI